MLDSPYAVVQLTEWQLNPCGNSNVRKDKEKTPLMKECGTPDHSLTFETNCFTNIMTT
jgi:hypothetical protein